MANVNAQLEATLARFANQPGVTADQGAKLRATITADRDLTQRLNQAAANGHLTGFALGPSGSETLTGSYDKASGVVTLPALEPGPAAAEALRGSLRLQEMSVRFAHSTYLDAHQQSQPVTQDMVTNLQATINSSPTLANEMQRAVTTVDSNTSPDGQRRMLLENFAPLSGTVAGGTFNPADKTMSIPPTTLGQPPSQFNRYDATDLTFVLGHETQHAFNQVSMAAAYRQFDEAAKAIARDNNPINDYTLPIEQLVASNRQDEAKAQIAGWNALLDRVKQRNPGADLTSMMTLRNSRLDDFVEPNPSNIRQAQAKPGLSFNTDGSLPMTPENIAKQASYYFDKSPKGTPGLSPSQTTGIGYHGDSDYPNYYGAGAVSRAIAVDRAYAHPVGGVAPQMHLNMQRLHFNETLLERNGITLPQATATTPQEYWDTSSTPPTRGLLQHTRDSHQHISPTPELDSPQAAHAQPGDPGHPDTALFEKIREGVRGLDQQAGKPWDENSERLSASLLLLAGEKGFTAKDDLKIAANTPTSTLGSGEVVHLWRTGHPSPDPAAHRARMPMQQALAVPAEQRFAQLEAVQQQARTEELQRSQQQDTVQAQATPARSM
ncbi:XVIPCD domain-containing protein [Xanthomonas sacchari]|uniref:XVIPCD domain-containing protein n=1 Tax=Xanthomonas sacchari TaxID=56458 RepID=UPI003B20DD7B